MTGSSVMKIENVAETTIFGLDLSKPFSMTFDLITHR